LAYRNRAGDAFEFQMCGAGPVSPAAG